MKKAKTITVCDDTKGPSTLDPHKEFDMVSYNITSQIFEGLVRFSVEGKIEPCLATQWERMDPKRIRFKLREGVVFHNGEEFDADAVKFSLKRQLSWLTMSPTAFMIKTIDRVEIIDKHTIDIVSKVPDGTSLHKLASFVPIIHWRGLGKNSGKLPAGTGPFKFRSWAKEEGIVLDKNENYWLKGYPKVDKLIFKHIPIEQQTDQLLGGNLDMVTYLPEKDTAKVQANSGTKVLKKECLIICGGTFNLSKGPFSDKRVRQAANYAVNKADIVDYALKGNGKAVPTFIVKDEVGFVNLPVRPFDIQKAKELLAEAGYGQGFKIKVMIRDIVADISLMLLKQLEGIGIYSEYIIANEVEVVRKLVLPKLFPFLPRWNGDLFISNCPNPTCHGYFVPGLATYSRGPYSLGKNAEFDRLFEKMIAEIDPEKHEQLAQEMNKYLYGESLSLMGFQLFHVSGLKKEIDYHPSITGMLDLRSISIMEGI